MESLGYLITGVSLVCGILLLSGHGSILLQGTGAEERKKKYDQKKMEKSCGIALLITGVLSVIDCFTTTMALKIAYLIAIALVFGILFWYMANKCKIK